MVYSQGNYCCRTRIVFKKLWQWLLVPFYFWILGWNPSWSIQFPDCGYKINPVLPSAKFKPNGDIPNLMFFWGINKKNYHQAHDCFSTSRKATLHYVAQHSCQQLFRGLRVPRQNHLLPKDSCTTTPPFTSVPAWLHVIKGLEGKLCHTAPKQKSFWIRFFIRSFQRPNRTV